jgi:hypothetical protein
VDANLRFAALMRSSGHTFAIKDNPFHDPYVDKIGQGFNDTKHHNLRPKAITKDEALKRFKVFFDKARGRELIGIVNPSAIAEIFGEQSKSWKTLASRYVDQVYNLCSNFVRKLLFRTCAPEVAIDLMLCFYKVSNFYNWLTKMLTILLSVHSQPSSTTPPCRLPSVRYLMDLKISFLPSLSQHGTVAW